MSYTSIQNLYAIFNSAVGQTTGLSSFHMINENEISKHKNYSYPLCVIEIPNSSISNVNRGWEEYEISCFIMTTIQDKVASDYGKLAIYDNMAVLLEDFLTNTMFQRSGSIIVDRSSIEIERFDNRFSDKCRGIKATFNITTPSALGYFGAPQLPTFTERGELMGLFHGSINVNRSSNTNLTWETLYHDVGSGLLLTYHQQGVSIAPTYEGSGLTFPAPNDNNNLEALNLNQNITFSFSNFSLFFRLSNVDASVLSDNSTLFSIHDTSNENLLFAEIISGGGNSGKIKINMDGDSDSVADILTTYTLGGMPSILDTTTRTIGLIFKQDEVKVYINNAEAANTYTVDVSATPLPTFTAAEFYIGGFPFRGVSPTFLMKGFTGTLKHFAIYNEAVSQSKASTIMSEITNYG